MIRTVRLSFSVGAFRLDQFNLEVAQGRYFVLLGPPGSGKTIFLECLCGLKRIKSGHIYIDGRDVTDLEPHMRDIGYVPQDYALFPHLSVERNIAFGLRVRRSRRRRGCRRGEISSKVIQVAEILEIRHLLTRSTNALSGGEKQRVALARALVTEPKVLLLDEPVCALDEATRQNVCSLLHRIQRQLGLTTVHVSHNLEEAFSVADRAAILHQGTLQQIGPINQLLRQPQNEFVASFMRCDNLFCGEGITSGPSHIQVRVGDVKLLIAGQHHGKIKFMIRPEDVLILPDRQHNSERENEFQVSLARSCDYGSYIRVELNGSLDLVAHLSHAAFAELKAKPQSDLIAVLHPENIHVLPG
ncbi:MAG: ABC transporter ATP-binding protein [Planctomycetota bacterium]|jgi:ABC-type sugar transport system ATPase subunit